MDPTPWGEDFQACVGSVSSWAENPEGFCAWVERGMREDALPKGVTGVGHCAVCGQRMAVLGDQRVAPHPAKTGEECGGSGKAARLDAAVCVDTRVQRFDRGTLRPAERLENGWMRVDGYTARVGVLEYQHGDGNVRRELVLPEELFNADSIASARMVPVTNGHPRELLDDQTAREHQVGSVGEALRADGDYLRAPLMLTDRDAVRAVDNGRSELSWGYQCTLHPPDDTLVSRWGAHDGIQRGRRYNHLALVDDARAGSGARLRLDSRTACMVACSATPPERENGMNAYVKIGSQRYDVSEAGAPLLQQVIDQDLIEQRKRADAAEAAKADGDKKMAAWKKRWDALRARAAKFARGVKAHLDAMKARMMSCDECDGTGYVAKDGKTMFAKRQAALKKAGGGDQAEAERRAMFAALAEKGDAAPCSYCDGTGTVRMHDAIRAMSAAEDMHPEEDLEEMGEECEEEAEAFEESDSDRESPEEEKLERAANPEHKDQQHKRGDARAKAAARRDESLRRAACRRAASRAALLHQAERHLGAEEHYDGKSDLEVQRAVLARLAPHLKLDEMNEAAVDLLYRTELARLDGDAGPQREPTASDRVRGAVAGSNGGARSLPANPDAALAEARARRDEAMANAWRRDKPAEGRKQ